jgi:CDP-diacylglycerol--glycerol-3-phosphate 3-phosphatidyltransferase
VEQVTIFGLGASVLALVVFTGAFFSGFLFYCLQTMRGRQQRSQEMKDRGETVFLPLFVREYWDWAIGPMTRFLIRRRVNPNVISSVSLALSAAAGAAFAVGYFGLGGWLYIGCGTCDMFDGKVARATQQSTKAGAFLDSVFDRYSEMFVLAGLGFYFRDSPVLWAAILALGGSLMVSYTRARGEGLGFSCREGGMQRAERVVYLGLAGIFGKVAEAIVPTRQWSVTFIAAAVVLIAVSANYTAVQRFFSIFRHFQGEDGPRQVTPIWKPRLVRKALP